jgi:transcriptional regulator with XRE-family HTH domain
MTKPKAPRTDFARRLRELREKAGVSQNELSKRSGVYRTTIGKLEKDLQQPLWQIVVALAQALNVPTDAFLGEGEKTVKVPAKNDQDGKPAPKSAKKKS